MRTLTCLAFFFIYCCYLQAQTPAYNFRRISAKDGISDGVAGPMAQDKYGYMWLGTLGGLNRYDGYRITSYIYNYKDSFSVPIDFVRTIHCDPLGTMWFGYGEGMYTFNYQNQHFELMPSTKGIAVNEIRTLDDHTLCLLTARGLAFFDINRHTLTHAVSEINDSLLSIPMYEGCVYKSSVYIASAAGIIAYHTNDKKCRLLPLRKDTIVAATRVAVDSNGIVWASARDHGGLLYKGRENNTSFLEISSFRYNHTGSYDRIMDLFVDPQNRLWLGTIWSGLVALNTNDYSYTSIINDYRIPSSIPENHINKIFMDRQGFMWLATEGSGVAYFQPDYNLFSIFFPEPVKYLRPHVWVRALAEDSAGNVWMGTGVGLIKQNKSSGTSILINRNEKENTTIIHSNSIRSLLCDDENNVWIGTSDGINMYETASKKMRSFDKKDSLPPYFFWTLMQDKDKTIWFGSNGGMYFKLHGTQKFHTLRSHPVLAAYANYGVRSLFQDSKGNIWIGLNGRGLILYDTKKQTATLWNQAGSRDNPVGNIITSIAEDKKGIMWFSSYYGIASYDYGKGKFSSYNDTRSMESLQISGLRVDEQNRLWLASPKGLLMLNNDRNVFKRFGTEDGLPDIQFSDQTSFQTKSGQFVYPTYDGYVSFNPLQYREKNISGNIIISSFTVKGSDAVVNANATEDKVLSLSAAQNFFNIELTAFNYSNPRETWYAYKLDGFDKEWTYTRNRLANYTNVPGGPYVFRYKASSDPNNWQVKEHTLNINIATIFYKTNWFLFSAILLTGASIMTVYRYRMRQKEKWMKLKNIAQLLEKEKTQVMYENLKQQLNPHFLFNSLSSLESLIPTDAKTAGEFLNSLGKTYRYILKSSDTETVPLIDEIKFAQSYIRLQQTRFEKGLMINIEVDQLYHHNKIVPVTLQNMIENAIKHNIIDGETPLVVDIYVDNRMLVVRNNLQLKNFVETSNRRGLANLTSLYHYLSDTPVEIKKDNNYFLIKIPLL